MLDAHMKELEEQVLTIRPTPEEIPRMENVDFGYFIKPKYNIGGDHAIFIDFKRRYPIERFIELAEKRGDFDAVKKLNLTKYRSGFAIYDVEGHSDANAVTVVGIHHTFLAFAKEHVNWRGEISRDTIEELCIRAIESTNINIPATFLYVDITNYGLVRHLSAAHPHPIAFSYQVGKIVPFGNLEGKLPDSTFAIGQSAYTRHPSYEIIKDKVTFPRKTGLKMNNGALRGAKDLLITFTDGFSDYRDDSGELYLARRAEEMFSKYKDSSAQETAERIKEDMNSFGPQEDDITLVLAKRKN